MQFSDTKTEWRISDVERKAERAESAKNTEYFFCVPTCRGFTIFPEKDVIKSFSSYEAAEMFHIALMTQRGANARHIYLCRFGRLEDKHRSDYEAYQDDGL